MTMSLEAYRDHMKRSITEIEQEVDQHCSPEQLATLAPQIMRVGEGIKALDDKLGTNASPAELIALMASIKGEVVALEIELRRAIEAATKRQGIVQRLAQLVGWKRQG